MIGPLPPPLGGTRVLFKQLINELYSFKKFHFKVINIIPLRNNIFRTLFFFIRLITFLSFKTKDYDLIALHCSRSSLLYLSSFIRVFSTLYRKPWLIRTFGGGDFSALYTPLYSRIILSNLNSCNAYLVETKKLLGIGIKLQIKNCYWYSNSRVMLDHKDLPIRRSCKKFIFVGHIRSGKGVLTLINAFKLIHNPAITLDFYGPLRHDISIDDLKLDSRISYKGEISNDQVILTLLSYDALVLPSTLNEGYPGVILEAYSAGIPVIVTDVGGIPEIVNKNTGMFVQVGDPVSLSSKMKTLIDDSDKYISFLNHVLEERTKFSSSYWSKRFTDICSDILIESK